jgi:60 kDa SS-A/Ro ribonucleoprotein
MEVRNHMAILRNLRNIINEDVSADYIKKLRKAFHHPSWGNAKIMPINFLAAAKACPTFEREIETAMLSSLNRIPKLPGRTILVVDVSGSMGQAISGKSQMSRMDSAMAMAMLAGEVCESVAIYATAGNDRTRIHQTELIKPRRGFAAIDDIRAASRRLGGGGIFTRQALAYIQKEERETPDRIMVFSDSQDCDRDTSPLPRPFGRRNYIVDVSANSRGINYAGVWDAEISGFSPGFLPYIAALEGYGMGASEDEGGMN